MIIKTITIFISLCCTGFAQLSEDAKIKDALIAGIPEAKFDLCVVNELGKPIQGAKVYIRFVENKFIIDLKPAKDKPFEDLTNSYGLVSAQGRTNRSIVGLITRSGYYSGSLQIPAFQSHENGKWQPWNTTYKAVLRKIINPIPMYAKSVDLRLPELGKPIGYDLESGDWTAPFGKGKKADIIFTKIVDKRSESDYNQTLVASFPNKGDGIQTFEMQKSFLASPYEAPLENYQPTWEQVKTIRPDVAPKWNYDDKRNYFIRVRTVLDERGQVVSAHYGKIYGDFMMFTHYLNPIPNDRNMEFDVNHNLIPNLTSLQEVTSP
jgi:hypothetical protein